MESNLSVIQTEIAKALEQLKNKALVTEADLAKKIRLNTKFEGKPKAGISLNDIENAICFLQETQGIFYSIHCNSANDLFFKKEDSPKELDMDFRQRRLKSERNMTILTSNDFKSNNAEKKNKKAHNLNVLLKSFNFIRHLLCQDNQCYQGNL